MGFFQKRFSIWIFKYNFMTFFMNQAEMAFFSGKFWLLMLISNLINFICKEAVFHKMGMFLDSRHEICHIFSVTILEFDS